MICAYIDGVCEPVNPGGTAAFGVAIFDGDKEIHRHSEVVVPARPRETSNNVAEYSAFLYTLRWLKSNGREKDEILFHGDSKLVINQMFGTWGINAGLYVKWAHEAQELLREFPAASGEWIPREQNELADELSKAELIRLGVPFRIQPRR